MVAIGADNTTDRRFRQLVWNILWSRVDFFLTSFPHTHDTAQPDPGENWFDDDSLPGIDQRSNGPGYTENLEGRNPTSHRASQFLARLSWAFLFFRLGRRNMESFRRPRADIFPMFSCIHRYTQRHPGCGCSGGVEWSFPPAAVQPTYDGFTAGAEVEMAEQE